MTEASLEEQPLGPAVGKRLRIGLVGTRGVPARYGGFETAVEEVGTRLAARGHDVTVYCRASGGDAGRLDSYRGMRLIHLPAARTKSLETLSHTALSALNVIVRGGYDAIVLFNAANAPFLPLFRIRRVPTATHVDGLEWRRGKWGRVGKTYYRVAESLAVRWSDALIADAQGISDYYHDEFGAVTTQIAYGAPRVTRADGKRLNELGLRSKEYHLVVARFEPENHVDIAIKGYLSSGAKYPLVVVGSAPYRSAYVDSLLDLGGASNAIRLLGGVWDQELLDTLYAHAFSYVHGHSVGGTNPSLLRAMGAGTGVIALDVSFNRDVLGNSGLLFSDAQTLATAIDRAEGDPSDLSERGRLLAKRAKEEYNWDDVALRYEQLCRRLSSGRSQRGYFSGRRRAESTWHR